MKPIWFSRFILFPSEVSKHSRNSCVREVGPFEHETGFYLEPSSAIKRTWCSDLELFKSHFSSQVPKTLFESSCEGSATLVFRHICLGERGQVPRFHLWAGVEGGCPSLISFHFARAPIRWWSGMRQELCKKVSLRWTWNLWRSLKHLCTARGMSQTIFSWTWCATASLQNR